MSLKIRGMISIFALCALTAGAAETVTPLSGDWTFSRTDAAAQAETAFDDGAWERVSVPHDWAIAGPFAFTNDLQNVRILQDGQFDPKCVSGRTGALPWTGVGWYRRTFEVPAGVGYAALTFEGAMAGAQVWIDGKKAGERPYGYIPFTVPAPTNAGVHTVAVRLENLPLSTRWYAGAGLYRPVKLVTGPAFGLAQDGTFVHTASLAKDGTARLLVEEKVRGCPASVADRELTVVWRVCGPDGREIASNEGQVVYTDGIVVDTAGRCHGTVTVKDAPLWSSENPRLCTLKTELRLKKRIIDTRTTRFGIRTVELTPEGFLVNGKPVRFNGVCMHHDLGSIGAAFNASAFRRQVRILKEMGANAIRTSHNPPAPDAMAICDEEGFLIMAEAFDMWKTPKVERGYSLFFKEWWERDLSDLVRLYRNHPSIVMWSIGNEIWEKDPRDVSAYARKMVDLCHTLDPSRPVTQGVDRPWQGAVNGYYAILDLPAINYNIREWTRDSYELAHRMSKTGIILNSEGASAVSSRGVYKFPVVQERGGKQPDGSYVDGKTHPDGQCSSYDVECCYWANLPDADFALQEDLPYLIGQFVWTGFDYLGEPTPYKCYWPSRSSYFGIVDLAGIPKDRFWLYRSVWRPDVPTLHLLPHWTFPDRVGQVTPVHCYTSYPTVELFVNGRSQGRRTKDKATKLDRFRLRWNDVVYAPGELKAVAYDASGKAVAEEIVKTAGAPAKIVVEAELAGKPELDAAYPYPLLRYYRVKIVDKDGNLCPDADASLSVSVTGGGQFRGVCNGDATSLEVFVKPQMKAFHGELVVTTEVTDPAQPIRVRVQSEGLVAAETESR